MKMKIPILKRMKYWHIYANGRIAYAVIRVPKGFKPRLQAPTLYDEKRNEFLIYAYRR